jgi:hypothetical protein
LKKGEVDIRKISGERVNIGTWDMMPATESVQVFTPLADLSPFQESVLESVM